MTELQELRSQTDRRDAARSKVIKYSTRVLKKIAVGDESDFQAEFLANICAQLDERYGVGTTLVIDWMLDHYIAYEFENNVYTMFKDIRKALEEKSHTFQNKFEYFNDCEAFYIPHKSKTICVFGKSWSDTPYYLCVDGGEYSLIEEKFYVRSVWKRTRKNCIDSVDRPTVSFYRNRGFKFDFKDDERVIYGDSRDPGHILTYQRMLGPFDPLQCRHGKCDNVSWDFKKPLSWFFEVNTLWTQLVKDG